MLTGDKLETAENIGYSCQLFSQSTHLFRIANIDESEIASKLKKILSFIELGGKDDNDESMNEWFKEGDSASSSSNNSQALRIEGKTFELINKDKGEQYGLVIEG